MDEATQPNVVVQATVIVQATAVQATEVTAAAQTGAVAAAVEMKKAVEVQAAAAEEASAACPPAEEAPRSAKRARPRGPTPVWGSTEPTWDGAAWVDESGNQRPKDQRSRDKNARRRTPEEQAANAAAERKRKKRKKEEAQKLKEEEQKLEQQTLPGAEAAASGAEGAQLPDAPPAAAEEDTLTRKKGYDTTNNLNKLLTQGFSCSIPNRTKKQLFSTLIMKINALEAQGLLGKMSKYQAVEVGGIHVVDVLLLVRKELECKEPHVSPRPAAHAAAPLRLTLGCRNRPATCL